MVITRGVSAGKYQEEPRFMISNSK